MGNLIPVEPLWCFQFPVCPWLKAPGKRTSSQSCLARRSVVRADPGSLWTEPSFPPVRPVGRVRWNRRPPSDGPAELPGSGFPSAPGRSVPSSRTRPHSLPTWHWDSYPPTWSSKTEKRGKCVHYAFNLRVTQHIYYGYSMIEISVFTFSNIKKLQQKIGIQDLCE